MILITTALRAEAKPLIQALGLKSNNTPLPTYSSDKYILVITGTGNSAAATATGWALGKYGNVLGAVNIGCAGSSDIPIGTTVIGETVTSQSSGLVQIPDILYPCQFKGAYVLSSDTVVRDTSLPKDSVCEMEAFGFMQAGCTFLENDKLAVVKIVTDDPSSAATPTTEGVTNAICNSIDGIADFIESFYIHCHSSYKSFAPDKGLVELLVEKYSLTASMTAILRSKLTDQGVFYHSQPDISLLPQPQGNTKRQKQQAFNELLSLMAQNKASVPVEIPTNDAPPPKFFSRIYVEDTAISSPMAKRAAEKLKSARIVTVPHYKAVFNRRRQNITLQQARKSLILARATGELLYRGSDYCNSFGFDEFYYCSTVMGCVYNCEYCYLKGMYPSANVVAFVNTEDFFHRIEEVCGDKKALICCSYDSDIVALDGILGTVPLWLDFAAKHPNLTFELRTKSANVLPFAGTPVPNVIVAYTVSPDSAARRFEASAPPTKSRLAAARTLSSNGWRVRLCMEPILAPVVDKADHFALIDQVAELASECRLEDVVLGGFRMNKPCFAAIARAEGNSTLFHNPYTQDDGDAVTYRGQGAFVEELEAYLISKTHINVVKYGDK